MKLKTLLASTAIFAILAGTAFAENGTNSTAAEQPKTIPTLAHCRMFADVNRSFITHLIPFVSSKSKKNVEFAMIIDNSKSLSENLSANQNIVNAAESQLTSMIKNPKAVKDFGIVCDNLHF
jgi:hypothetical protein